MRKLYKRFYLPLFCLLCLLFVPTDVKAGEVVDIPVNIVDDISIVNGYNTAYTIKARYDKTAGWSGTETKKFTLTEPCYVSITTNCILFDRIDYEPALYADINKTQRVKGDTFTNKTLDSSGESVTDYLVLNAGTYYLGGIYSKWSTFDSNTFWESTFSCAINAQPIKNAVTTNTTKPKAVSIKLNTPVYGISSNNTRTNYFKFTLNKQANVKLNTYTQNAWGMEKGACTKAPVAVGVWDNSGVLKQFFNIPDIDTTCYDSPSITLNAGTYYIGFLSDQYWDYYYWDSSDISCNKNIKSTLVTGSHADDKYIRNGGLIYLKVITSDTPKTVKHKSVTSSKAKVSFKKTTGAKGYEIQYGTNKNFKKAKTVKTKKVSYTLKKLKKGKTYYYRVRSWKYDDYNNKVYSTWTKAKKFKTKR